MAAIFPVGGYYMQKATIADNGSAIAQAVMNDIVARGMLNPRTWRVMTAVSRCTGACRATYCFRPTRRRIVASLLARWAPTLGEAIFQPAAMSDRTRIVQQFGSAFVIDPIGVAVMAFPGNYDTRTWNTIASAFPATAHDMLGPFSALRTRLEVVGQPSGRCGVSRFNSPNSRYQMDEVAANHYFRGSDDLATELPDRDDRPAAQNWDVDQERHSRWPGNGRATTPGS